MPQTIALQRGTTTVAGNDTTYVTLFTQSGGIATRVIVNQLGIFFSSAPNTPIRINVLHDSSGGQSTLLGSLRDVGQRRSVQFTPAANDPFAGNVGQTSTSGFKQRPRHPIVGSNGASGVGSANTGSTQIEYYETTDANFYYSILPSNFYMGPGDSLRMIVEGGSTANISYSFTTITES
jgi:hypothetical protein